MFELPTEFILLIMKKKIKIALKSQREIHTVAARAAPGDLGLKSYPKDYQQNNDTTPLRVFIMKELDHQKGNKN